MIRARRRSGDRVSSDQSAQAAYLGLDESIDKAITLGFAGFNAAQSANIPTEQTPGDVSGTSSIGGQVDEGQSANKQTRLQETLVGYADVDAGAGAGIVYATDTHAGALEATDAGGVDRKPGSTHITGTATSQFGTYDVDLTR